MAASSRRQLKQLISSPWRGTCPQNRRHIHLLVERVDVREDAIEVRIRAEGLVSLVAELRQGEERTARAA